MCDTEPNGWKRSLSEPCLLPPSGKRRRLSRSSEDVTVEEPAVNVDHPESPHQSDGPVEDERDLVQITLDHICELQRKLNQEGSDLSEEDTASDPGMDADGEYESDDDADSAAPSTSDRDVVLAGFEFCTREALKFLVEREHLGPQHPAVRQLTAHLSARRRSIDCGQVLANYLTSPTNDPYLV